MSDDLIKIKDLFVTYTNPLGQKFNALDNINLIINKGDYLAIVGTSGSGKTTLSNVIGLLNSGFKGSFYFEGLNCNKIRSSKKVRLRGDKIGFIFQDYVLMDHFSALENVALSLHYSKYSKKQILEIAESKLRIVGLGDKLHHKPYQLSGGQKQRVSIARALAKDPIIIIADEPTGALDQGSRAEVLSILQELNESGVTIITVTHSAEDALAAKRVIQVESGRIVADETQRKQIRFYGSNLDLDDDTQLKSRKEIFLRDLSLKFGSNNRDDFRNAYSLSRSQNDVLLILERFEHEWFKDSYTTEVFTEVLKSSDHVILLLTASYVVQASEVYQFSNEILSRVKEILAIEWTEESSMYILLNSHKSNIIYFLRLINVSLFFNHGSSKVRATSIRLLRTEGVISTNDKKEYVIQLLKDEDPRVRSNTLDFIHKHNFLGINELNQFEFDKDTSSRVKAAWIEILIKHGQKDKASEIVNSLLDSSELSAILAGLWVKAKEKNFNLYLFIDENCERNPSLLKFADDIKKTYSRVVSSFKEWRE